MSLDGHKLDRRDFLKTTAAGLGAAAVGAGMVSSGSRRRPAARRQAQGERKRPDLAKQIAEHGIPPAGPDQLHGQPDRGRE